MSDGGLSSTQGYEKYRTTFKATLNCSSLLQQVKQVDEEMQEYEQMRRTKSRMEIRQAVGGLPQGNTQSALQFRSPNRHQTAVVGKGPFQRQRQSGGEHKENLAGLSFRRKAGHMRVNTEASAPQEGNEKKMVRLRAELGRLEGECTGEVEPAGREAVRSAFRVIAGWLG